MCLTSIQRLFPLSYSLLLKTYKMFLKSSQLSKSSPRPLPDLPTSPVYVFNYKKLCPSVSLSRNVI